MIVAPYKKKKGLLLEAELELGKKGQAAKRRSTDVSNPRKKSLGDQSCDMSGDEGAPGSTGPSQESSSGVGVASWEHPEDEQLDGGMSREPSRTNSLVEGSRENSPGHEAEEEGEGEEVWSDEGEGEGEGDDGQTHLMPPPSKRPSLSVKNAIRRCVSYSFSNT